jgi:hypothetical protein
MWDISILIWDQPHASGVRSLCGCAALWNGARVCDPQQHGVPNGLRLLRFCRHARGVVEKKAKTYATNTQAL